MSLMYLNFLEPLYVESLRHVAHTLAEPTLCFGIPCVYFLLTMAGYSLMRYVDFYVVGAKVSALKGKRMIPATIVNVLNGGKSFEVAFSTKDSAVLPKESVTPVGYAPPDWFKLVYNTAQVSLSLYCAIFGLPVVSDFFKHPFGVNMPMNEDAAVNNALHYCICVHFLSKFLDYVDTFLIIIGKKDKQLSVLHVYHHCSISMVWGYLINTNYAFGTVCFGAWINAVVHSIMYTYYGLTASRIVNTKPFKPYVTSVQLTQFCLCITHAIMVITLEKAIPRELAALQFGYHCTMIALFGHFFYQSYVVDAKKTKVGSAAESPIEASLIDTRKPKKKTPKAD
mmetsp:Transcript_39313/g.79412  ORF Transcript_39313/g.79412 Transcript_39313/m.79412 type:complete len:339 (-) Transcript_39313:198-1214(-)